MACRDVLFSYPNFNEGLIIQMDDIKMQLMVVMNQHGNPIDFYSLELNTAQTSY